MSRIPIGGRALPIPPRSLLVALALIVGPTSTAAQGLTESAPRPGDVETLDGIVAAFYDVISTPPGGTVDWARDSTLYLDGVTFTILGREGGEWTARRVDHGTYATESTAFLSSGFLEREIHREVHRFGPMASVFSTYEWRRDEEAPPRGRGINSMELFHDGRRWWIVGVMWASEDPGHPIPEEYLPGRDGAIRGAPARGVEILEGAVATVRHFGTAEIEGRPVEAPRNERR